jgi:pyridoxamine 5'-phosphate oxidase
VNNPIEKFRELFERARVQMPTDATEMVVASVGEDAKPSARVVLLKDFDARGFVFYTNLQSRKGRELLAHPHAALCFRWPVLEHQIRIEGRVEQVSEPEADAYFATRPRLSQIGAWASEQSQVLSSRSELERRVEELNERYLNQPVPRPPHWSGLRVVPEVMEFWEGRLNRLHVRTVFRRRGEQWLDPQLLFP